MLRSESVIFATRTKGSSGVDPGRVLLKIVISSKGDSLNGERKRLVFSRSLTFSTFAMLRFIALALRGPGGGTDLALMRPTNGSLGETGVFEGIAPSST